MQPMLAWVGLLRENGPSTWEDKKLQAKKVKRAARKGNDLTLEESFAVKSRTEVLPENNAWY
jgi:hypothetical protein